jgi:hypothetical protein
MIDKIRITADVFLVCSLLMLIQIGCEKPSSGEKLVPLTEGQEWISEDGKYTALIPRDWTVGKDQDPFGGGTIARAPKLRNMYLSITSSNEGQAVSVEEETERLLSSCAEHMPPTLGSTDYKELETHTGKIGGYPAAWRIVSFKDSKVGPIKRLAVAIGTPTTTYNIDIMARKSDFDKLRPVFERIAGSFKAR